MHFLWNLTALTVSSWFKICALHGYPAIVENCSYLEGFFFSRTLRLLRILWVKVFLNFVLEKFYISVFHFLQKAAWHLLIVFFCFYLNFVLYRWVVVEIVLILIFIYWWIYITFAWKKHSCAGKVVVENLRKSVSLLDITFYFLIVKIT